MLNKLKTSFLAIFMLTLTACQDDFLTRTPTDAISADAALASVENMQLVLNGIHRGMFSQSQTVFPGGNTNIANDHWYVPQGDNLTGGIIHSANANNLGWRDNMQWLGHTIPTSLSNEMMWYHRYNIILHANLLINGIPTSGFVGPELQEILGQAHTYRAFAYLSLVQHFARGYLIGNPTTDPGVPLLFETEPPYTSQPRSTVEEIYVQIGLDLDAAIAAFATGTGRMGSGPSAKSQLNVNVAHGLKARWALSKGDWAQAAESAVAARAGFPLLNEATWLSGFNSNSLSEVIWGSNVITTETTFFRSYFYLICNTFNGSQNRSNPKIADRRIVDAIPATDFRRKAFLPDAPNTNNSAANGLGGFAKNTNPLYPTLASWNAAIADIRAQYGMGSGQNLHPYMSMKHLQALPGTTEPDDIIYMRSAEMYLIEAEAEAMLGNISAAQTALATLVDTRDTGFDETTYNTQQLLMDQIKFQRRLELWGEGFGYTDQIRWDEGIDHAANGGSGASEVLYQAAYQVERPSLNDAWIFKIPQAEINANPNLSENN
jgi:starch-binding outer membrane protein, SusD/RagB family